MGRAAAVTSADIALFLAAGGLVPTMAFAQASRQGYSGPFAAGVGLLLLPIVGLLLWVTASQLGWWTVGVFIGASFTAGMLNGSIARNSGPATLLQIQPITAGLTAATTIGACALHWLG